MSHNKFSVEELLKDEYFVKWVLEPNQESNFYWEQWIARNQPSRENVVKARQLIGTLHEDRQDHQQILGSLLQFLKEDKEIKTAKIRPWASIFFRYAAAVALLILTAGAGYLIYQGGDSLIEQPVELTEVEKTVPMGQKNTIRFIEGSEVKLNSGAQIRFLPGFEENRRLVKLEGEAFFDVAPDENRPFYIEAGNATVKVVGTSFNVNSYQGSDQIRVAVVSGVVEFSTGPDQLVQLKKNEMAIYNKSGQTIEVGTYDYLNEVAWKDGVLVFDHDNIQAVIRKLQRWYGVEVILGESKISGYYNGEFENASLELVLEGISFAYDLDYSINGKTVELK